MTELDVHKYVSDLQMISCDRYTVLLSNFRRYFKLASYISTHTNQSIVIAMGVPSLRVSTP